MARTGKKSAAIESYLNVAQNADTLMPDIQVPGLTPETLTRNDIC